jgi:UDP-N-acetylmuramate dehydrogenase
MMKLEKNIILAKHTTLKTGGVADYFATVKTESELISALTHAKVNKLETLVIGGGSNILFSDEGYRGLIINNQLKGFAVKENKRTALVTVGAGETLDAVVRKTVTLGFWGLENLSAIPGSVGATPIQNVGAYGVEVSQLIHSVTAIKKNTFQKKVFKNSECNFNYRNSFFKTKTGEAWIIVEVVFKLSKKPKPKLDYGELKNFKSHKNLSPLKVRNQIIKIRSAKFPDWREVGTAGSFFKNPIISNKKYQDLKLKYPLLPGYITDDKKIKISLGWVLDHVCGLRGYCKNGVCLYERQALVLINKNNSSTKEIKKFVSLIKKIVEKNIGVTIEPEVRFF